MAEPAASDPGAAMSQMTEGTKEQPGHSLSRASPGHPQTSEDLPVTSSFQAVNAKPFTENVSTSTLVNTAAQGSEASGPTPPAKDAAVTQNAPQATQTSSDASRASQPPNQLDGADATMSSDITYGTRSRNRTGNSRPNYAEDQDMDFEISSAAATTKKRSAADSAASTGPSATDTKRMHDVARHVAGSNGGTGSSTGSGAKELTPGVASNVSKKRKAAGAPTTMLTQTPPTSNSPAPTATRKVVASSTTTRETNVMSFSKHRQCLNKKGELVADDGTKLSVNGKLIFP